MFSEFFNHQFLFPWQYPSGLPLTILWESSFHMTRGAGGDEDIEGGSENF